MVYCWGAYTPRGIDRSGCKRFPMKFVGEELLSTYEGRYLSYKYQAVGNQMVGIYRRGDIANGIFSEVELPMR